MLGNIKGIFIYGLWGDKDVKIEFEDNNLILLAENGSGKTTVLRIIYEVLACRWPMLSTEDFIKIEIFIDGSDPIMIEKSKIKSAKNLLVDIDSRVFRSLPFSVRRSLFEKYNIFGQPITYEQVIDAINDAHYGGEERISYYIDMIREKTEGVEEHQLERYSEQIKSALQCDVIYLPTYRRIERKLDYDNEMSYKRSLYRFRRNSGMDNRFIEIVKTGMGDVERFIEESLDKIRHEASVSATKLNYQCFKGILNKASNDVIYNSEILSEEAIEKVFGSINEDILSQEEISQIRKYLKMMSSSNEPQRESYEQIVYYFYSMLYDRYLKIKENEKDILDFFDVCNAYLANKKFIYDEKEYGYKIMVNENNRKRTIELEKLSSGEKQIVSIFSYLYLSQIKKAIILIDEPEISLSVKWQRKFLMDIYKGSKCTGIVSVTHSPFVFDNELRSCARSLQEFIHDRKC